MARKRRTFTPEQKVAILRLHFLEKKPISDICQENDIAVNLFYLWQKQFFDNGAAAFVQPGKRRQARQDDKDRKIANLEGKLLQKNEVLAEVMQEFVLLKKELGGL